MRLIAALAALLTFATACASPELTPTAPVASTAPATDSATPPATDSPTPSATPSPSPTASPAATPSPLPTASVPPAAEAGTLTIWTDAARAPLFEQIGQLYSAQVGVPLAVHALPFEDIARRLSEVGPLGQGPDIVLADHEWLPDFVANAIIEPVDLGEKEAQLLPVGRSAFSVQGQLYGLPYVGHALALYYNADLMPEGRPPAAWEELKTVALDLQDAAALAQPYCLPSGDPYHSHPLLTGFGGYLFGNEPDGSYRVSDVGLDSPGGLASASELDALVKQGVLKSGVTYDDCLELMTSRRSALFITGTWALPYFTAAKSVTGLNFAVAPLPVMAQEPRSLVGVQGLVVSSQAVNKSLALSFLTEFVASDDVMRMLWESDPRVPMWAPLADQLADPNSIAFIESARFGEPVPVLPRMDEVWATWHDALDTIFAQAYDAATPDAGAAYTAAADRLRALVGP